MKNMSLLICLFTLIAGTATTSQAFYDPEILQAPEGKEVSVVGDGFEGGFSFTINVVSDEAKPKLHGFIDNNRADCSISILKTDELHSIYTPKIRYEYYVEVSTSVEGDTGGCTASVTDDQGNILKTVEYTYITNY